MTLIDGFCIVGVATVTAVVVVVGVADTFVLLFLILWLNKVDTDAGAIAGGCSSRFSAAGQRTIEYSIGKSRTLPSIAEVSRVPLRCEPACLKQLLHVGLPAFACVVHGDCSCITGTHICRA